MPAILKSVIQDLINDRTEQAQVSIHQYIVGKTQQIAGLAEAKSGSILVVKVGFTSANDDGDDKDDFGYYIINDGDAEVAEHLQSSGFDWDESLANLDHMVQNITGGFYVPGSAHTMGVKMVDSAPSGRKYFSGPDASDILAA